MFIAEKSPGPPVNHQRAKGEGRLSVFNRDGRTAIRELFQQGCAKIRVPSAQSDNLQAVMINTSGGMTGGDRLHWQFECEAESSLTITTQACERVYKASADTANTSVKISAQAGARVAWMPQETIIFDDGSFNRRIDADLAAGSEALFVESAVFGRKTMGEVVHHGQFRDRWRIRYDGRLIHGEDFVISGPVCEHLLKSAVTDGNAAIATILLIAPYAEGYLEQARDLVGETGGASFWNGKLLARLVADDSYTLRQTLTPLIGLLNRDAALPKTWTL